MTAAGHRSDGRSTARKGRPVARHLGRDEEILRIAADVFRTHGYHGARLDDVARRAGIRTANLHHYFESKESILGRCSTRSRTSWIGRSTSRRHRPRSSCGRWCGPRSSCSCDVPRKGVVRDDDPGLLAQFATGAVRALSDWYSPDDGPPPATVAGSLTSFIVAALLVEAYA